jgi:hypothetical protein
VNGLFQILAGSAGLAGISLGVVMVVYRDIIGRILFSKFTPEHAFQTVRLIISLTFAIGVMGMCSWVADRNHWLESDPEIPSHSATIATPTNIDASSPAHPLGSRTAEGQTLAWDQRLEDKVNVLTLQRWPKPGRRRSIQPVSLLLRRGFQESG